VVDLDAPATQVDLAYLVGASQPAIAKHYAAGYLPEGGTLGDWLTAYCERLRLEAAGRVPTDARERRDLAIAHQAEIKTALDQLELFRQKDLILDIESVRAAMTAWAAQGKNAFLTAADNIITAIESAHGITVDRAELQRHVDAALRAVGDYQWQPRQTDRQHQDDMDTAA
jgi:hypothetical protein